MATAQVKGPALGFNWYEDSDAVYIRFLETPYHHGHRLDSMRRIDYDEDNRPMGVALLGVSHGVNIDGLPESDAIVRMLRSHGIEILTEPA